MQCIGNYPIHCDQIRPYCGRQIVAITHHGDMIAGILDRAEGDHLVLRPYCGGPGEAVTQSLQQAKVKGGLKVKKQGRQIVLTKQNVQKAKTNLFPFGSGGFGGYGSYGYYGGGARNILAFTIPYVLLATLLLI